MDGPARWWRFEALQEIHIHIKNPSWMRPPARLVSKLHSSGATFNCSMSTRMEGGGEEEEWRREVRGAERQGGEVREADRQRNTVNVFDADELAYKIM